MKQTFEKQKRVHLRGTGRDDPQKIALSCIEFLILRIFVVRLIPAFCSDPRHSHPETEKPEDGRSAPSYAAHL
jgi:hypothetical protein